MQPNNQVLIIGAGLAGLSCALRLQQAGIQSTIVEASDQVGGRVRTDRTEGFLLDRGFQIFLTAYPEASSVLNYDELELKSFFPGALIYSEGKFNRLVDPFRCPTRALETLMSRIGTIGDKLKVAGLRLGMNSDGTDSYQQTTMQFLQERGFSREMIDRFFRPFFSGIFLEESLETSASMFEFVFSMLAAGENVLPAQGMQAIPLQIASKLRSPSILFNSKVKRVRLDTAEMEDGNYLAGAALVVATDELRCQELLGVNSMKKFGSQTCIYFTSDKSPVGEPILILNGDSKGVVNNLCVPSDVSASYAPSGSSLISASLVGDYQGTDEQLENEVRDQMLKWFGPQVGKWKHLRTYRIKYALPDQSPQTIKARHSLKRQRHRVHFCGDYIENGSINGAMLSGRKAAEAVIRDFAL